MNKKKQKNLPMIGGILIISFFLFIAVFAEQIAPYDPTDMMQEMCIRDRQEV